MAATAPNRLGRSSDLLEQIDASTKKRPPSPGRRLGSREGAEPAGKSEGPGTDPPSVPVALNDCGFVAQLLCASVSLSVIWCPLGRIALRINPNTLPRASEECPACGEYLVSVRHSFLEKQNWGWGGQRRREPWIWSEEPWVPPSALLLTTVDQRQATLPSESH